LLLGLGQSFRPRSSRDRTPDAPSASRGSAGRRCARAIRSARRR
jgi:hypothetical protein